MTALVQLLSYISWVCTDETYDRFRETIRKRLPEAEDTVISYAEKLIEQGRNEGTIQVLEKQLTLKFGAIESTYRTLIANATLEQLDRYVSRVLFAEQLADVFAD
jgi:hypothetical protein